jgi:hypothetical protein
MPNPYRKPAFGAERHIFVGANSTRCGLPLRWLGLNLLDFAGHPACRSGHAWQAVHGKCERVPQVLPVAVKPETDLEYGHGQYRQTQKTEPHPGGLPRLTLLAPKTPHWRYGKQTKAGDLVPHARCRTWDTGANKSREDSFALQSSEPSYSYI